MQCDQPGCKGDIADGTCQSCGISIAQSSASTATGRDQVITAVRSVLNASAVAPSKEALQQASAELKRVVPYNYEAWRLHADLLLNAINQLKTRQIEPDETITIFITPLREDQLRNAAEQALRQCAHFADSAEKRIALIDEANSVRQTTWF